MKCIYCGSKMKMDDSDVKFPGNKDIYWICDCGASCLELIRYNRTFRRIWDRDDHGEYEDWSDRVKL